MEVKLKQAVFTWIGLSICLTVVLLLGSSAAEIQVQGGVGCKARLTRKTCRPFQNYRKVNCLRNFLAESKVGLHAKF